MDLIIPDYGLLFWTGLTFLILLFLLVKFAWKPILGAVNDREQRIADALSQAEKAKEEMKALQSKNEDLLKEARAERDAMIRDAKETVTKMVEDARQQAKNEGAKLLESAKASIEAEKNAAVSELKTQVASFSLEIAEKILRKELSSDEKQKSLADKLAEDINLN